MKHLWKPITLAMGIGTAAIILTGAVCKCTERAKKTFKKDSNKETKKESN